MTDMERLFRTVEGLKPDELQRLRNFIEQRQRATWWIVTPEQIAQAEEMFHQLRKKTANGVEADVNEVVDET
jgi:hypothetical protein